MMRNATMFIVGMLMIAMLVGFGASAGAPADIEDGYVTATREKGQFLEVDDVEDPLAYHIHTPWDTDWLVVGSMGGAFACCGKCVEDPGPEVPCPPDPSPGDRSIRV